MATLKVWNGSAWVEIIGPAGASGNTGPQGPPGLSTGDLGDIADVTVTAPSAGDFISWNGVSAWTNQYNASEFLGQSHVSGETHYTTGQIDHNKIQNSHNLTSDIDHDQLTNYSAAEHFTEASIDHTNITNIGTLSHAQLDAHVASGNPHIDWTSPGAGTIDSSNYTDNDTTDHTSFTNIGVLSHADIDAHVASGNPHIDWTQSSAGTIHSTNYVDNDTTDHTALSNIGTNTHAQIDTHIASTSNPHSVTAAQVGAITGVADDTAPELGGSMDANAYTISWEEQYAYGAAGSVALDFSAGNKWHIQLDANLTASFTDPHGATNVVIVVEQAGGNNTLTWPSAVKWPAGRTGVVSTGNGAFDVVNMYYNGSGTYYGMTARDFQ